MSLQPTNIRRPPNAAATDGLEGRWVTSFSGWQLFYPRPTKDPDQTEEEFQARVRELPPIFPGRSYIPPTDTWGERFLEREGYIVCSGLMCLKLDGRGQLTGASRFVRGGTSSVNRRGVRNLLARNELTGTYELASIEKVDVLEGNIQTQHRNKGDLLVTNNYHFFVTSSSELAWIWAGGFYEDSEGLKPNPYRPLVTHGNFTRVDDDGISVIA